MIPFSRDEDFVERRALLSQISEIMSDQGLRLRITPLSNFMDTLLVRLPGQRYLSTLPSTVLSSSDGRKSYQRANVT